METMVPAVLGVGIILAAARDLVHELFHPESRGSVSRWVMHGVWRGMRRAARYRRTVIYQAGPGELLQHAAESVLKEIGEQFLGLRDAPPEAVIDALARDHLLDREAE